MWRFANLFACMLVLWKSASSQSKVRGSLITRTHLTFAGSWCVTVQKQVRVQCPPSLLSLTSYLHHGSCRGASTLHKYVSRLIPSIFLKVIPSIVCVKLTDGSAHMSFYMIHTNPPNKSFCDMTNNRFV